MAEVLGAVTTATKFFFEVNLNSRFDRWIYRGFIESFNTNNQTVP